MVDNMHLSKVLKDAMKEGRRRWEPKRALLR